MKFFAFGDSIIKGVVLRDGKYNLLPQGFFEQCAEELGVEASNFGRFGCTITQGTTYFERQKSIISESDHIFFEYGGNDCDYPWKKVAEDISYPKICVTPMDVFHKLYQQMIVSSRNLGALPVLLSLPPLISGRFYNHVTRDFTSEEKDNVLTWLGGDTYFITQWHEHYNLAVFSLAQEMDVPVIDITTPFLVRNNVSDYICPDGIHPNERGHSLIKEAVMAWLKTNLVRTQ